MAEDSSTNIDVHENTKNSSSSHPTADIRDTQAAPSQDSHFEGIECRQVLGWLAKYALGIKLTSEQHEENDGCTSCGSELEKQDHDKLMELVEDASYEVISVWADEFERGVSEEVTSQHRVRLGRYMSSWLDVEFVSAERVLDWYEFAQKALTYRDRESQNSSLP